MDQTYANANAFFSNWKIYPGKADVLNFPKMLLFSMLQIFKTKLGLVKVWKNFATNVFKSRKIVKFCVKKAFLKNIYIVINSFIKFKQGAILRWAILTFT